MRNQGDAPIRYSTEDAYGEPYTTRLSAFVEACLPAWPQASA